MDDELKYLIWDRERKEWWKSRWNGYTTNLDEAYRYTQAEACFYTTNITPAGKNVLIREDLLPFGIFGEEPIKFDTEGSLSDEYENWLEANHLDAIEGCASAEEFLATDFLTDGQRAWLVEFTKRWEAVMVRQQRF